MRISPRIYLLLYFNSFVFTLFAQYEKQDQITTFSSRLSSPIEIEVVKNGTGFLFYCHNKSYYPYLLKFKFTEFANLTPYISDQQEIVHTGTNRLFEVKIADQNLSPRYAYSISYSIHIPNQDINKDFPYLLPLMRGHKIELVKAHSPHADSSVYLFRVQPGDTVYSIRKGLVTSTHGNDYADRISRDGLEVLQKDGTIAIYFSLDPNSIFVKPGQKIYPGQPIGIAQGFNLRVEVFQFVNDGKLRSLPLKFCNNGLETLTADRFANSLVEHPNSLIEKELNKSELKKLKKGTLYSFD